jgi:pimeloyl-ACP methyl ester carboxylesterase
MITRLIALMAVLGAVLPQTAHADAMLKAFAYPHPVQTFAFTSQMQNLDMAYMDVAPKGPARGQTVVLLHGKNFCGATWGAVITLLSEAGYRVVVPDQIGFCKSSKPEAYQYSFHQLAANTKALLGKLGVEKPIVLGHSMGGMLAFRYALMYGAEMSGLVVVNPLGLEDWKAKGVPMATLDQLFERELKVTAESIKRYEQNTYYAGHWEPAYDVWVDMLAGMYKGADGRSFAWTQARTADIIQSQPVVHEFANIKVPTLVILGLKDNTANGRERASPEVAKALGNYPELAKDVQARIPGARLVTFPDLAHSPHIQAPEVFNPALLKGLAEIAPAK